MGIVCVAGHLCSQTVKALIRRSVDPEDIIVISRDGETASYSEDIGVQARQVDPSKELPVSVLGDVDKLFLIANPPMDATLSIKQHVGVIYAAKEAGVRHIVYTSLANFNPASVVGPVHAATEYTLLSTGIPYTIIRTAIYLEKVFGEEDVKRALASRRFLTLSASGKVNAVSRRDLAAATAVILTAPGHANKTYNLTYPCTYTFKDLARKISELSGKDIEYKDATPEEVSAWLDSLGFEGDIDEDSTATQALFAGNFGDFVSDDLVSLIGRENITSPESVIKSVLS